MKSLSIYSIILLFFFTISCNKTPLFPDPGMDTARALNDTVRRDTMDIYTLSIPLKVPNGVQTLELLDAHTYEVVKDLSNDYRNKKDFNFMYSIDLREVEEESKFSYIVRVVDNDIRTFNKAFSVVVKPLSKPIIKTFGGNDGFLGIVNSAFDLRLQFETGINFIRRWKISFGNTLLDEKNSENEMLSEHKYTLFCNLDMVKDTDYTINIELEDNKGTVAVKNLVIRLVDIKYPSQINITEKVNVRRQLFPQYRADGQVYLVEDVVQSYNSATNVWSEKKSYLKFDYDDQGRFIAYTPYKEEEKENIPAPIMTVQRDDQGRILYVKAAGTPKLDIGVRSYFSDGRIETFAIGTDPKLYSNISYMKDFKNDEMLLTEYWGTNKSDNYREQLINIVPVVIPTCIKTLPAVTPLNDKTIRELFTYKYIGQNTARKGSGNITAKRSYTQDASGKLTSMIVDSGSGITKSVVTYTFIYK